ncbi:hypothetical protein D9M72_264640 [compost metagenome]
MRATLSARPPASTPIRCASCASESARTRMPDRLAGMLRSGITEPGRIGPHGYLWRKVASNTIHAGTLLPVFSWSRYMAGTNSEYGAASLTKRRPCPFTTRQPGMARSIKSARCFSSPRTCTVGAPQTWDISATPAPAAWAARMPSPVLLGGVALQAAWVGCGRYCSRMAWLRSKPPAARITPRSARISTTRPSCTARTPRTVPSSTIRSCSAVSSHNGIARSIMARRRPPARLLPSVSRRSRRVLRRQPRSSQ